MKPIVAAGVAFLFLVLGLQMSFAGNADRVEEILGTPQGIAIKDYRITAKGQAFTPNLLGVSLGDYFVLRVTALDGEHVFKIPGTNIRHVLKKGQEEAIVLYARDRGRVPFVCDKFGHVFQKGTIVIE